MAGDILQLPEIKVKYKDVFSLRNLYIMLHETMLEEGWFGADGSKDGDDVEILYSENVYQKGIHRGGKELWFWWRLWKYPEGKYNTYFRNHLDIDAHVVYLQNVEIVQQGKKMTAQNCEIEMFFRPRIEKDFKHIWGNHWLLKHFKHIYEARIIVGEIDKREKELWRDANRIHAKVKQYFNLRNYTAIPEPFFARQFGYEE
ncbi:MAG TPA: hypothetical protein VJI52_01635 [Candidatus Nanoarchaeia archaeon]|nr:hypothetical protein [Candidatus Nanoarchaeia archaeon]